MQQISEKLTLIDDKIKHLEEISSRRYKCGTNLTGFGNIQAETKVENLRRAYSHIKRQLEDFAGAKNEFGETRPLTLDGANAEDWLEDILLRNSTLRQADSLKELKEVRDKLVSLMPPDERADWIIKNAGL